MERQVPLVFPAITDFCQKALNVEAKIARSDIEVMMEMHERSKGFPENAVDWKEIEKSAAAALPTCSGYVKHLSGFLQKYSGDLLPELASWLGCISASMGMLGGEFPKATNEVRCDAGESIPYLAIACMKAQKLSTRVEDGVCKSIPCSKIQAFSHKNMKKEVHLAERHLRVAREIVEKLGLRDKALVPLGHLDVRIVLHLTGQKKLYEDREYPDLDAISQVMAPQIKLQ